MSVSSMNDVHHQQSSLSSSSLLLYLRPEVQKLKEVIDQFVLNDCIPAETVYEEHMKERYGTDRWTIDAIPPILYQLQKKAKTLGIWNIFLPPKYIKKLQQQNVVPLYLLPKTILNYREYGIICESLGQCPDLASMACNCSAPDTGNMEVLIEFGTKQQQEQYLIPLLEGTIRSTFLMTEPSVASSDPTNLQTKLIKKIIYTSAGNTIEYILSGTKWWSTGAMDPRCRFGLCVAKMDYNHPSCQHEYTQQDNTNSNNKKSDNNDNNNNKHNAHTIVIVPINPQVTLQQSVIMKRPLTVFGYDDAPFGHAEVLLNNVVLSSEHIVLGEGTGFQISQARLGPGRIHHCMRAIGMASRCYELMLQRSLERTTFGKYLWEHGGCQEQISDSYTDIMNARLITLHCANVMDTVGVKESRHLIASIKVIVPQLAYTVIDRAVQLYGGAGVCSDFVLCRFLANIRTLRIADGPDAVHKRTVALTEIKRKQNEKKQQLLLNSNL